MGAAEKKQAAVDAMTAAKKLAAEKAAFKKEQALADAKHEAEFEKFENAMAAEKAAFKKDQALSDAKHEAAMAAEKAAFKKFQARAFAYSKAEFEKLAKEKAAFEDEKAAFESGSGCV